MKQNDLSIVGIHWLMHFCIIEPFCIYSGPQLDDIPTNALESNGVDHPQA